MTNSNVSANMMRSRFFVCPVCGNILHGMGEAVIYCHGVQLQPEEAEEADKGHPVFVAQHATATCCRECIRKWHKIQPGKELSQVQQEYLVDVIMTWIQKELER